MMEDFLGVDCTTDEIREAIGVQHCGEEVFVVKPLVGQSIVLETSQAHVHSPPIFDPPVIDRGKNCNIFKSTAGRSRVPE
jgi:hypothetical protein